MRVIAGSYRRHVLQGPPGLDARPTSDRLRETIFNILQPVIEGTRFLDLCAGSGAVGIEALSREAEFATFVDRSTVMTALVKTNVAHCKIPETDYEVVNADALTFLQLRKARGVDPWDLIYYDPPYEIDYFPLLSYLGQPDTNLLSSDGRLLVEHARKLELPESIGKLQLQRQVKQAESCVSFYQWQPPTAG